jgi:hypothetical protein
MVVTVIHNTRSNIVVSYQHCCIQHTYKYGCTQYTTHVAILLSINATATHCTTLHCCTLHITPSRCYTTSFVNYTPHYTVARVHDNPSSLTQRIVASCIHIHCLYHCYCMYGELRRSYCNCRCYCYGCHRYTTHSPTRLHFPTLWYTTHLLTPLYIAQHITVAHRTSRTVVITQHHLLHIPTPLYTAHVTAPLLINTTAVHCTTHIVVHCALHSVVVTQHHS